MGRGERALQTRTARANVPSGHTLKRIVEFQNKTVAYLIIYTIYRESFRRRLKAFRRSLFSYSFWG